MRLAEQQFPLPDAEKFDGEVSWRHLLEFCCETGPQHPQTVSGFQSVRPPTAQWLQPNGTSARPNKQLEAPGYIDCSTGRKERDCFLPGPEIGAPASTCRRPASIVMFDSRAVASR